jgi:5-methylcytosine-specific restriction protein A
MPTLAKPSRNNRAQLRRLTDKRRGNSSERGYGWKWQQARELFLREFPLCGMRPGNVEPVMSLCHRDGRTTAGFQVDHVEPHRGDQVKFWDRSNWQTLCASCGARKSRAGL